MQKLDVNFSLLVVLLAFFIRSDAQAPDVWTLQQCIEYAQNANLDVQRSQLQLGTAVLSEKQAKQALWPSVNAFANGGLNFGRSIDPTSNTFNTERFGFGNYGIGSDLVIFQGGQLRHNLKKTKSETHAAEKNLEQARNALALTIANQYLNVLLAQERLSVNLQAKQASSLQYEQVEKMIKAGLRPEADLWDVKAQLARANENIVLAENALDLAWLSLKQSLLLDFRKPMALAPIDEEELDKIALNLYSYETLLAAAIPVQPAVQAAFWNFEAARWAERMARGSFYPSVFLRSSIGSRYSDAARIPTDFMFQRKEIPGIYIDGVLVKYEYTEAVPIKTQTMSFYDQYDLNLNYGIGLTVNVPIYNNYNHWGNAKKARLAARMAEIQYIQAKETLGQEIAQALANCKAAMKAYESAKESEAASIAALVQNQKRYELGAATYFQLAIAQNNADMARIQTIIAKYNLYFNQKMLDFYAGKKIQ